MDSYIVEYVEMLHTLESFIKTSNGLKLEMGGAFLLILSPLERPLYLLGVDISRTTGPIRILRLYREPRRVFSVALIDTVQLLVHVRVSIS
jgi:hypothetical protein